MRKLQEERYIRDVLQTPPEGDFQKAARRVGTIILLGVVLAIERNAALAALFSPLFIGLMVGACARRHPVAGVVAVWLAVVVALTWHHPSDLLEAALAGGTFLIPPACVSATAAATLVRWLRGQFAEGELG